MSKKYLEIDVYTASKARLHRLFDDFERVYLSFSAGKDSSALLHLTLEVAKERGRLPLDVLTIDLEGMYKHSHDYMQAMLSHPDVRPWWICLPIHLRNSVSQYQPHWLCWDAERKDDWIRPMPDSPWVISDETFFPFFRRGMEFEEFTPAFGEWFADGIRTACLVAIRSDESLNRYRTIASITKTPWQGLCWTTKLSDALYNAYPIYDWSVEDVWIAHGKQGWPYNKIYDLMHMAGVSLHQQRLCQPYGDDQRRGIWLFKILEPETWTRVVNRVQGANFGNRYVQLSGNVLGNIKIRLPKGHTWKSYAQFLLDTMPPHTAAHYRQKIAKFLEWWDKHEGVPIIPDEADANLEAKRQAPSWRRICKVLLKNDYWCKGLSFTQTKREIERQQELILKYMEL